MKITAVDTYMPHTGGTKFYEVQVFHNEAKKRYVVVNRWGKKFGIQ
jgi:hypothetical protein